jgi:DNA-binding CsgD family transcriptional regulator
MLKASLVSSREGHAVKVEDPPSAAAAAQALELAAIVDEIDYGALLVTLTGRLRFANRAARLALGQASGAYSGGAVAAAALCVVQQQVQTRQPEQQAQLLEGIAAAACRGLRSMLQLGRAQQPQYVAVLPLYAHAAAADCPTALLLLGRRDICEPLGAAAFARCHGLTPAESAVMMALAQGLSPQDIARHSGVAPCTVRSQIQSIRNKTGLRRIPDLIARVATLPPMTNALRLV